MIDTKLCRVCGALYTSTAIESESVKLNTRLFNEEECAMIMLQSADSEFTMEIWKENLSDYATTGSGCALTLVEQCHIQ
jgi:hypothetical protein